MTQQPSSRSRRMCPASHCDLLGRQRGGRLVEDDDLRLGGEHPDQLDDLPVGDGEVGGDGAAVDVLDAVPPQDRVRRRGQPAPADEPEPAAGRILQQQVLRHREVRQQRQLLERGGDAEPAARGGLHDPPYLLPEDLHRAPVGADQSTEDLDERALAGAVLTGERVDLPGTRREGRVPERLDPAEGAVDTGRPYRHHVGPGRARVLRAD